jgi:hypothetical protein
VSSEHLVLPELLSPLPQCTEPNQRIHADLFGPLKTTSGDKKFILCLTDAFTKYVVLVTIPNKEAFTVATAILNCWICHFGLPLEIVMDQGKEFTNLMAQQLFKALNIKHSSTSSYYPQCNSQAEIEVCNIKLLQSTSPPLLTLLPWTGSPTYQRLCLPTTQASTDLYKPHH